MKAGNFEVNSKSKPSTDIPSLKSAGDTSGHTAVPGRPDESPVDSPEVASSVTRNLLNPKLVNSRLLLCGIDTLDLGLYVSWDDGWKNIKQLLEEKKISAQSTTGILDVLAQRE